MPPMDEQPEGLHPSLSRGRERTRPLEDEREAVLVQLDETLAHQVHSFAHSHFLEIERGKVQDGFRRSSGKGSRMIMVHESTKCGPSVTYDGSRFPSK